LRLRQIWLTHGNTPLLIFKRSSSRGPKNGIYPWYLSGIWIYNTKWFGPFNKRVKGVRFSPIGNGTEMRWVYLE
jgi:hypothetical protein